MPTPKRALILTEYRKGGKAVLLERVQTEDENHDAFRVTICRRFPSLRGAEAAFLAEIPPARRDYFAVEIKMASKLRF